MLVIGIAGGTGSGKTTVVRKIAELFPMGDVSIIPQDSYYKDSSHIPVEERQNINFDHPNAFDFELLIQQVRQLKQGQAIEQPIYSYLTCTRAKETIHIKPQSVIIIEGILIYTNPDLCKEIDIKVFVDADPDDRLIRVIARDIAERGRTVDKVIARYEQVLKPMHLQFIEPTKRYADIIIPQGGHNEVAINILKTTIEKALQK